MDIIKGLKWRYATKKFNPNKKLSEEQVKRLLEAMNLSASSYGLQAWKIVHVKNEELREELLEHSWGQRPIVDASDLFILCRYNKLSPDHINAYINRTAKIRAVEAETLEGFKTMLLHTAEKLNEEQAGVWLSKQLYIVLGTLLTACAVEGIDSLPMEGFNPEKYDEVLQLKEQGLKSVLAIPVGYRSEEDHYQNLPKVRKSLDELVIEM